MFSFKEKNKIITMVDNFRVQLLRLSTIVIIHKDSILLSTLKKMHLHPLSFPFAVLFYRMEIASKIMALE